MRTMTILTACCIMLLPLYAQGTQDEATVGQQGERPASMRPIKAKPAQKPKATSSRDKLSISGYGSDPGEETQEKPNPLKKQVLQKPESVKSPTR